MSRTETRHEIEEWTVEVCDNCGHDEGMHYKTAQRVDVNDGTHYIAFGCMVWQREGGRLLEGCNPYPRCTCTEFK